MSNTDRMSLLERWADGMETLEQYYEGKYGPPATPAQLPAITTYDGMLEAIADGMERAKRNINKKSSTYHSDSVAYVKTVPAGDVHYASLEQIGGKTLAWNQLVDSGTTSVATISGHKYYTLIDGTASIVTADGTAITIVDDTADMVCDLTLMFGVGNEPSTTADFTVIFGATHYSYNAGTLVSAGVTSVVSKKADITTIATYSIPAEIQALDGYGWSAGSVYNYIDYERKVFVKRVGKLHYDGTGWTLRNTQGNGIKTYSRQETSVTNFAAGYISNVVKGKVPSYVVGYIGGVTWMYDLGACMAVLSGGNYVYLNTTDISNTDLNIYYTLATPIETDISAYLADDNLIEVESSGTLTFENVNGDDYRIPVPSSETFVVGEP